MHKNKYRWSVLACILLLTSISTKALAQQTRPTSTTATEPNATAKKISPGQAAILGVVEGITEYLPVSSTGHLILVAHWMGLSEFSDESGPFGRKVVADPAVESFEIVIQLGAILAVLGLYRRRVEQMVLGLVGKNPAGRSLLLKLFVAFLPAAVVGLALHDLIGEYLFSPLTVAWALGIGGVLMIVVERVLHRRRGLHRGNSIDALTYWQALAIGLAQCLAMWPGTSRSMITIIAALLVGMNMVAAAEFSFLLALPTLGAATVYSGLKHWQDVIASAGAAGLAIGLVVSGIVAAIAVKGFVKWLTRHGMTPFGIYRIALGIAVYCLLVL